MLLHTCRGPAPNPRKVAVTLAEKRVTLPEFIVPLHRRAQREPAFLAVNPLGQLPALVFDDGEVLTESIAICRWLESEHPDPPLFGRTPREAARIDMHLRRAEQHLAPPLTAIWRHADPRTAAFIDRQFTDWGEANRPAYVTALRTLDRAWTGGDWFAGDIFTIADIAALTVIDFGLWLDLAIPADCERLAAWHARASARPSARASGPGTGHGW